MVEDGDSSDAIEASEESSWLPTRGTMCGEHEVNTKDKAKAKERAHGSIKAFFQELPLGEAIGFIQHTLSMSTLTCLAQLQGSLLALEGARLLCTHLSSLACMGVHESG